MPQAPESRTTSVRQPGFSGGEIAPELQGKTETKRHAESLDTLRQFFITPHGAAKNRAGTLFCAEIADSTRMPRLLAFTFSDEQSLLLEFGHQYFSIWKNGARLATGVVPYIEDDLQRLQFAQSGDVITICHPDYAPRELTRFDNTNWTLAEVDFSPQAYFGGAVDYDHYAVASSEALAAGVLTADYDNARTYKVGEYAYANQAVSPPDANLSLLIFMARKVTTGVAPGRAGDAASVAAWVLASDVSHPEQEWDHRVTIRWRDSNGIVRETLKSGNVHGGYRISIYTDRTAKLKWTAPAPPGFSYKIIDYQVYKGRKGIFGRIGSVGPDELEFVDNGIEPDFSRQPPRGDNPFEVADGNGTANTFSYPAGCTYFEGRRVFYRSDERPNWYWGSNARDISNFDEPGVLTTADESYRYNLESRMLQEIRAGVGLSALIFLTGQGEWALHGDLNGAPISPLTVIPRQQSAHGSGWLPPLVIGNGLLYAQAKGNTVRDFFFDYNSNAWVGAELSALASHFFEGEHEIVSWAYAAVPWATAWMVRDDGVLLSLAYDRSKQMAAWGQHAIAEGNGDSAVIEQVCVVPGDDNEDDVYLVVKRTLYDAGGAAHARRYMERMASRLLPLNDDDEVDVRQAVFLDCAVRFDGRNTLPIVMQLTGETYAAGDIVALHCSDGIFTADDVGDAIVFDVDGDNVRARVIGYVAANQVTVELDNTLTADQIAEWGAGWTRNWAWARRNLSVPHLLDATAGTNVVDESTLGVLADGNVADYGTDWTRATKYVVLARPAVDAVVGFKIEQADVGLLPLAGGAAHNKTKLVRKVGVELVSSSRGLKAGVDEDHLSKWEQRTVADEYAPVELFTGTVEINVKGKSDKEGRVLLRQVDPLPCTIIGVTREVEIGPD